MKKKVEKKGIIEMNSGLSIFNHHAAGIDIGGTLHCVAISNGNNGHTVKTTSGFTCDLIEIVDYLLSHGITTVAMESTGVYWLPLYIMLEEAGIEPYLVNAKHVKNVTGRKKDDTDAIWLQKLHTYGLLQKSFQPDNETRILREFTRHRKKIIDLSADAIRRMEKTLELMNIKIHTVLNSIRGKSGMLIVKAILAGERDPEILWTLCDGRVKATREDIIKSLEGIWKDEYLFMLEQAVENFEFHQNQIKSCEEKIKQQLLKQVAIVNGGDITMVEDALKIKPKKYVRKNQFDISINAFLIAITGVDLSKIPGIGEVTVLELISEIGLDMTKWKSEKHFCAWLNLVPNTKISGGKILSSKMKKKKNRPGQILKQAVSGMQSNKSSIGAYYRKMGGRLGGKGATLATAHKVARIIYKMLLNKVEYKPEIQEENQQNIIQNRIKNLEKQLEKLKRVS